MRNLIFGLIVGGLALKLYRSTQARELVRDQLANAPTPLRQGAESLAASTATRAHQVADMIDAAPVPPQIKDQASQATATLRSVASKMSRPAEGAASESVQATPDAALSAVPDEVLAEEDAAARAASEAQREQQLGA